MTVPLVSDAKNRFTKDRADTIKMSVPEVGSEVGAVGSKVGAVGLGVGSGVADH